MEQLPEALAAAGAWLALLACVAAIAEHLDRRDERTARRFERALGIRRYATGCPPQITRADVDREVSAYMRATAHEAFGARERTTHA